MNVYDRMRAALERFQIRRLIRANRAEIANEAARQGPNAVVATGFDGGILFAWSRAGVGFGEITVKARGGRLVVETEHMSDEFVMAVIAQAVCEGIVDGVDRRPKVVS